MMKILSSGLSLFLLAYIFTACVSANEEELFPDTSSVSDVSFMSHVVPILETNCYSCHSTVNSNSGGGVALEEYADVLIAAQNGSLVGAINHSTGFAAMPIGANQLSVDDIEYIEVWINEGALNN